MPLILWPYTSELFEFNKIVITYFLTILIVTFWAMRMVSERKLIFRRTILDIPLIVFLGSQLISTLISIDTQTSWLGYYSRFNGGFLSTLSYLLLYWAFVSNIDKGDARKLINITLGSAVIVSIYGVLERLGIDKDIWQQAVQQRVFSTLGQPNWLAAWLTALIPITWVLVLKLDKNKITFSSTVPYLLSLLFFTVLLFTGSRSGILGFAVAEIVFWGIIFLKSRFKYLKRFFISNMLLAVAALIFGTQFTPSIFKIIEGSQNNQPAIYAQTGATALETGGTESGTIRKIVWQGAIEVWKHYPIFGTGVETFAYSYYLYRPAAHNMTSEWDFIYNKAHNEYLNFLANTGVVGIIAYLTMIGFSIYLMVKNFHSNSLMSTAFISGYISILITNFFGFSVIPIQLLFFLYPAFSVILAMEDVLKKEQKMNLTPNQKVLNWVLISIAAYFLFTTSRYWYVDYLYAKGLSYNKVGRQDLASQYLNKAIKLEPDQSIYYAELAKSYTNLALSYNQAKESTTTLQLTEAAIDNSIKAVNLSPANLNLKRMEFGVFVMLSVIDPNYLLNARDVLVTAAMQAPTDAKIRYNLGLIYSRIGQNDLALQTLKETVELKPNYKDARLAYAILLIDAKENSEARTQLEYILTNIDPTDSMSKQYLESIN